ncbi:MAG: glycine zipper 2TM domain-containing protein [Rhodocyclaceae bacterium]|nr:glycine zipper 2TM domain-containing protein [Rhodocyclaceae bacterium]
METQTIQKSTLHPMLWIAAIAVTLFSLVGIGAVTGLIPTGKSTPAPEVAMPTEAKVAEVTPPPAPTSSSTSAPAAAPAPKPAPKPVAAKPEHKPVTTYSSQPRNNEVAGNDVYRSDDARPQICYTCGTITAIIPVTEKGEGSGLGAVAGGVVGAIVGNQIGKGSGRDVARIAGIAGGAYAGHQIEKSQRSNTVYDINIRLEDGTFQQIRENAEPVWRIGDRVRIDNGRLLPR